MDVPFILSYVGTAVGGGAVATAITLWFKRQENRRAENHEQRERTKHMDDVSRRTVEWHKEREQQLQTNLAEANQVEAALKEEVAKQTKDVSNLGGAYTALVVASADIFRRSRHTNEHEHAYIRKVRQATLDDICEIYELDREILRRHLAREGEETVTEKYEPALLAAFAFDLAMNTADDGRNKMFNHVEALMDVLELIGLDPELGAKHLGEKALQHLNGLEDERLRGLDRLLKE